MRDYFAMFTKPKCNRGAKLLANPNQVVHIGQTIKNNCHLAGYKTGSAMSGPLDHLTIIEASRVMPGSIAGMLLADHGAEVIKIEPHGGAFYASDITRKSWDRGKKSIELDYENAQECVQLKAILKTADVFIHSLEPAEAEKSGLDESSLAISHPSLVVCALSAYGQNTPFSGRPYGESLAAALLGTMVDKASPFRAGPVYLGHPALHYGQAFLATIGILSALRARHVIGLGQQVEATLLDAMLAQSPMNNWWQEDGISYIKAGDSGAVDRFGKTRLMTAMFECSDGLFLQIHTGGQGGFKAAMDVLGFGDRVKEVVGAPEMSVPLSDDEHRIARVEVYDAFKTRPRDEWISLFQAADVAALPVLEPAEVLLDPQTEFANQRIELKDDDFGTIHQSAPAVKYKNFAASTPLPAPKIGAQNGLISEIAARPAKVIKPTSGTLKKPLEGIKLLDFSSFFAVGYGGRLLSDLGADVIKVETPGGDQMRPLPDCFGAAQRGKRDIVLNLKNPEGLAIAQRLVASADVVMHNLRPGKAEKLGVGFETLLAINPKLIYAYLPGYGSKGPKSLLKSFAPLVSGWTGLLYEGGGEHNPPTRSVFGNEDYNNGFLGAVGVLMALERRTLSGKGEYMECPQLHSSLFTTAEHFLDANRKPVYGMRLDKGQMGFNALDRLYKTTDGYLCICCRQDDRFAKLMNAIGKPELVTDPRFANDTSRMKNDTQLIGAIEPFFAGKSNAQAFAMLDGAGVACEIARETSWVREVLLEGWAEKTGRVIENLDTMYGHVREFAQFCHLSRTPSQAPASSTPRLGEHTREIMAEIGYSQTEIEDYLERKVAMVPKIPTGRIDSKVSAT